MPGRIRTVKPEWLDDELIAGLCDACRVLSIAVILMADDHGNGRAHPAHVASLVWMYRRENGEDLWKADHALSELHRVGFIERYVVAGQTYFHIRNWEKHQRVAHAGKGRVPAPSDPGATFLPRPSRDSHEILMPDLRSPISDPKITDHDPKSTSVDGAPPEPPAPLAASSTPEPLSLLPVEAPKPSLAETIFAAYIAGWARAKPNGRRAPILTAKRRNLIVARLREFSAEDLALAARGVWLSQWHVENGHTELEKAFKDAGRIERFREIGERGVVLPANQRGPGHSRPRQGLEGIDDYMPEDV